MLRELLNVSSRSDSATESRSLDLFDKRTPGLRALSQTSTMGGVSVNEENARRLSSVFACQRILSDGVSTLPIVTNLAEMSMRHDTEAAANPAWLLEPNDIDNSVDLLAQIVMSLLTHGNAYIATTRDPLGKILELRVLEPTMVDPVRIAASRGSVAYRVQGAAGGQLLNRFDIYHVRGLMKPGALVGLSPLDYARESVALGIAAQDYGATFFRNSANPSAVVEIPGEISEVGLEIMRTTWNERHQGSGNAHKLAVFTEGATLKPISMTPEQAQFLATRGFQVADIARFFGVPPHLIGDASGSTSWGSGLAEQSVNYTTHSLRPWVTRIELALSWLARSEQPSGTSPSRRRTVSLRMDHLTRGDFTSRIATYSAGLAAGIWCLDEVRAMEGLAPLPDGQGCVHRVPGDSTPASTTHDDEGSISDPLSAPLGGAHNAE